MADFHIHSKYSRAVSKEMTLENLDLWARKKGILVLGTGDFTHPRWFREIKEKLEPAEAGLFKLKSSVSPLSPAASPVRFMLTVEISSIYSKNKKVRRVHNLVFVPSLAAAEKINQRLSVIGNLEADGRPILGLDSKELLKIVLDAEPKAMVVPAHCLLPGTLIKTKSNFLTPIQDVKVDDLVYTHNNRWRKVTALFKRSYKGKVYKVRPYYFRQGLATTPEHPFYVIRTAKNCHWNNGICKPSHEKNSRCKSKFYKNYHPTWIRASDLQKGDVLVFPRFKHAYQNHSSLKVEKVAPSVTNEEGNKVTLPGTRTFSINNLILIDKDFCRLAGYFLAEGHTNGRDAIGLTFHKAEQEYIKDVKNLVRRVWGLPQEPKMRVRGKAIELTFYSKILSEAFSNLFYSSLIHNASTKALPDWMLGLPPELHAELIKGWWRGDKGYTSSRVLMNQMKIVFLRLGIIPSILVDRISAHRRRGKHILGGREIHARHDNFMFSCLSFFEDKFGFLESPEFRKFKWRSEVRHGWIDEDYVYLPIRDIEISNHEGIVYNLEVEEDNSYVSEFATIHNCWTPWFSVFGSMSGFDSLEECFDEHAKYIYAVESGLSSDPAMNWRLSKLDSIAIISNSDSHSLERIGREANVFETELSYDGIAGAVKSRDPKTFSSTIEFFPEEGKYHYDGHRACNVSQDPAVTREKGKMCPVCRKPLTIGVLSRVEQLADRPPGAKPEGRVPFKSLVTLDKIIGDALQVGERSKAVAKEYEGLIQKFGTELSVLLDASESNLKSAADPKIAEGILRVREGRVKVIPGYDGEYGKISIFGDEELKTPQESLF